MGGNQPETKTFVVKESAKAIISGSFGLVFGLMAAVFISEGVPTISHCVWGPGTLKNYGPIEHKLGVPESTDLVELINSPSTIEVFNTGLHSVVVRSIIKDPQDDRLIYQKLDVDADSLAENTELVFGAPLVRTESFGFAIQPRNRNELVKFAYRIDQCRHPNLRKIIDWF